MSWQVTESLCRFADKCKFIKKRLAKKYTKVLRMPDWDRQELDELGPGLRASVEAGMNAKLVIRDRLDWDLTEFNYKC